MSTLESIFWHIIGYATMPFIYCRLYRCGCGIPVATVNDERQGQRLDSGAPNQRRKVGNRGSQKDA